MDELDILNKTKKRIKYSINRYKTDIISEYIAYKRMLFIYDKLNFIFMKDNKIYKETMVDLVKECDSSIILLDNLHKLFKRVNKQKLNFEEILYYYNTIIDYFESVVNIKKERLEKLKELANIIKCYKQDIQYISNKNFTDSNENIENMKTYSEYIKSL